MQRSSLRTGFAGLLLAVATTACATASQQSATPADISRNPAAQAAADGGKPPYTAADVKFMQGMIAHHGQALVMAALAPTNGARADVRVLAARIIVAQQDEIDLMQTWLRDRGEKVPDPHAGHDMAGHGAATHDMAGMTTSGPMMPGMLSPAQMAELKAARGAEFDRLFLTYMIQHHEGAITMVQQLFSTPGGGQELNVWKFAAEVEADQGSEIERMRVMLGARPQDQ